MCTVGACLKPSPGIRLIFFENRDRPTEGFKGHKLELLDGNIFGVYDYRSTGLACGLSLKTGLYMGVANIRGPRRPKSRGVLILETLKKAGNLVEAKDYAVKELFTGEYSPGVFILTDGNAIVRIEGYGEMAASKQSYGLEVATNRVRLLPLKMRSPNSERREAKAYQFLQEAEPTKKRVIQLLTSHSPPPICRHEITLSSVIAVDARDGVELLFAGGQPCNGYTVYRLEEKDGKWAVKPAGNI